MKISEHHVMKYIEAGLPGVSGPRPYSDDRKGVIKKTSASDNVQVSRAAIEFSKAKGAANAAPEIRTDRVEEVLSEVRAGEYSVNTDLVASKLLREHIMDELLG